jgi:hypothetical protein
LHAQGGSFNTANYPIFPCQNTISTCPSVDLNTFCQRDISEEWAERRWKRSDPQAALNLDLCPLRKRDVAKKFFTIGYGGTEPGQLISILKENGVEAVVDVRLWPHRASMGSYPEFGLVQHGRIYDVHARCAVSGFSPSHDI